MGSRSLSTLCMYCGNPVPPKPVQQRPPARGQVVNGRYCPFQHLGQRSDLGTRQELIPSRHLTPRAGHPSARIGNRRNQSHTRANVPRRPSPSRAITPRTAVPPRAGARHSCRSAHNERFPGGRSSANERVGYIKGWPGTERERGLERQMPGQSTRETPILTLSFVPNRPCERSEASGAAYYYSPP